MTLDSACYESGDLVPLRFLAGLVESFLQLGAVEATSPSQEELDSRSVEAEELTEATVQATLAGAEPDEILDAVVLEDEFLVAVLQRSRVDDPVNGTCADRTYLLGDTAADWVAAVGHNHGGDTGFGTEGTSFTHTL